MPSARTSAIRLFKSPALLGRTLYIPLIQAEGSGTLRLAAMTPGFLEGEDRYYTAYVNLREAENAYPSHDIVEARVPHDWLEKHATLHQMTAIRGMVTRLHGIETDARDHHYDIRADLPATFIVGQREARANRITDPVRHGGDSPFSEKGLEMLNLCDTALRVAQRIDKLTETLVYDIANSPEWNDAQVQNAYGKYAGLANWRKAAEGDSMFLESKNRIMPAADEATRQQKIASLRVALDDLENLVIDLDAPHTRAYLEPVRDRVAQAKLTFFPVTEKDASSKDAAQRIGKTGDLIGGTKRSRDDKGVIAELEGLMENLIGTYGVETREADMVREEVQARLAEWRVEQGYLEAPEQPKEGAVGSERITDSQMARMEQRHVSVNRLPS